MAWTYIIECADGSYYVASTYDIERLRSPVGCGGLDKLDHRIR